MERNQTIAIVVIIVIVAGAAVGYYLFVAPPAGPTEEVILMGTTDSVEYTLDIAQSWDYFGWEIIGSVSSGLVDITPGSEGANEDIFGALAASWTASAGATIWDFTLREGVLFEDGREFNSSDVVYTFERNCNLTGDGLWRSDSPQRGIGYAGEGGIIDNVTATGEFTVRFELNYAFAPFLQLMSATSSFIVDRANSLKDNITEYHPGDPRGSYTGALGPYLLDEWDRTAGTDNKFVLVKNPDYWNVANEPKTDKIIIQRYASDTALTAAIKAGDIDIAYRQMSALQIEDLRDDPNVRLWEGVGAQIQYMIFQQAIYPYNETPVRQALTAALNRSAVCSTVFLDQFVPLYSMIPNGMAYHKPTFEIYGEANYTFTQTTLAAYGYNSTNKLQVELWYESEGHYPQSAEQALVYEDSFEASGVIDVELFSADWSTYKQNRDDHIMQVYIYGWYPDYVDPDNYIFLGFAEWLQMGYDETTGTGVIQADYLKLGRNSTDSATRELAYETLQDMQAVECAVVPLWQSSTYAASLPTVHGIVLDITLVWRHWLLYLGEAATTGP
ncbi:MAG: ABC transporter substrate-binding protein [Promethearchaeota archaeon]